MGGDMSSIWNLKSQILLRNIGLLRRVGDVQRQRTAAGAARDLGTDRMRSVAIEIMRKMAANTILDLLIILH